MRKILLIGIVFFSLSCFAQEEECDTPCGYCNCEDVEGEASVDAPVYTILASGLACLIGFLALKKK